MSEIYFFAITTTVIAAITIVFDIYFFCQKYMDGDVHKGITNICGLIWQCALPVTVFCWMTIANANVVTRNGITFALIIYFPVRKIFMVIGPWLVPYIAGQNTWLANNLRPILYPDPINKSKKPEINKGIVWIMMAGVDLIFFVLAAICWAWKGLANNRVNVYTHIFSTLPTKPFSNPVGFAFWAILLIAFIAIIVTLTYFGYLNFKSWGSSSTKSQTSFQYKNILKKLLIALEAMLWGRKIYSWFFLGFGIYLALEDIIFMLGIHAVIIIAYLVAKQVANHFNSKKESA